jgi:hypothetical protein
LLIALSGVLLALILGATAYQQTADAQRLLLIVRVALIGLMGWLAHCSASRVVGWASARRIEEERCATLAWQSLGTVPTQLTFSDAVSYFDLVVEVLPQIETAAAEILDRRAPTTSIPVVLRRVELLAGWLTEVLLAGDAHESKEERKPFLVQAESLGKRVNLILHGLGAASELSRSELRKPAPVERRGELCARPRKPSDHEDRAEYDHGAKPECDHGAKAECDHGAKAECDHGAKAECDHGAKAECDHGAKTECNLGA